MSGIVAHAFEDNLICRTLCASFDYGRATHIGKSDTVLESLPDVWAWAFSLSRLSLGMSKYPDLVRSDGISDPILAFIFQPRCD